MRPRLIIVGAGLGGCCLADAMADEWDVTVVELRASTSMPEDAIVDVGRPAVTRPHLSYGLGGTTSVWHNGLIEIGSDVFAKSWPFPKTELKPYYAEAFTKLSAVTQELVSEVVATLKQKMLAHGVPGDLVDQGLFYPKRRINVWEKFSLRHRVRLIEGEVLDFLQDGVGGVSGVVVRSVNARSTLLIEGDVIVLAAGGLGTPLLLQKLAQSNSSVALQQAGRHYEDHPTGFVAEVTLNEPIYKLWNFSAPGLKGNLRLPIVIEQDGLQISFQFRPAAQFGSRTKVSSILNELRNEPYNFRNYLKLFSHADDILDILSFRFGLRWPTKRYSLLMVAQQAVSSEVCIWRNADSAAVLRNWVLDETYMARLEQAIHKVLDRLSCRKTAQIFPGWAADLMSSAHHSGTARMHTSPNEGVCNENAQVHGVRNLYVCDGALVPASGYANTGLTIAALALRLANFLKHNYGSDRHAAI
jgi:hypothetical protein